MRPRIILIILIFSLVISVINSGQPQNVIEEVVSQSETDNIIVYFPRLPDIKFVGEEIKLEHNISNEEKIKLIINRLIKGSDKANLIDVIPSGSKVNNVYVKNNTAFVDFSKEFVENHPGGSLGEYNTIYSIVNSITEIDGIEQVVFLIDGERQTAYKGHTQFDMPIIRDETLIVKE